jgi:RNA polymerase sigma factor (sigma-70 family)
VNRPGLLPRLPPGYAIDAVARRRAAWQIREGTSRIGGLVRWHGVTARPFEQIVAEHGPVVMRVCRAVLGPADAGDAWSETFLSALRAYPKLRPGSNIRGWLVTIAHRKAIDLLRGAARGAQPTGALPELATIDRTLPDDGLRAALEALPPKQRGAVIYRYLAELSYAEVGQLLACSPAAARRSAADGIAQLRKHYPKGEAT